MVADNGNIGRMITNKEINLKSKVGPSRPLSAKEVQDESTTRWQIEQMHWELKQLVGT
jgi:hypothetical protein